MRLNRALEELEKTRAQLKQAKEEREGAGQGARADAARLAAENARLRKRQSELIIAFKKQVGWGAQGSWEACPHGGVPTRLTCPHGGMPGLCIRPIAICARLRVSPDRAPCPTAMPDCNLRPGGRRS